MLIADLDRLEPHARNKLERTLPSMHPRVWGGKVRNSIHRLGALGEFNYPRKCQIFCDMKIAEVLGSVESLVRLYADLPYPPEFLSLSGEVSPQAIEAALRWRGGMEIIYIPILSDYGTVESEDEHGKRAQDFLFNRIKKAVEAGIECTTCPAWLLPQFPRFYRKRFRIVIATGTRSTRTPSHEHKNVRTLQSAYENGATHVVVGREVSDKQDKVGALRRLANKGP